MSGDVVIPSGLNGDLTNGILFAVYGGMIIDTIDVSSQMSANGGPYTIPTSPLFLPGGSTQTVYGVEAFGWSSTTGVRAVAVPVLVSLSPGNATGVDMDMVALP